MRIQSSFRPPDWIPLERALVAEFGTAAIDAIAAFWFVGFADGPADVGDLRLYEHSETRRYIALDSEGGAYGWMADIDGFCRIEREDALVAALA